MKTLAAFAVATAFFAATSAFATSGAYQGQGLLEIEGQGSTPCQNVNLDIVDNGWSIDLRRFDFDCNDSHGHLDPRHFDVQGNDIYLNGEPVGRRDYAATTIQIRDPYNGSLLSLHFQDRDFNSVDVVEELGSDQYNQRLSASLRRFANSLQGSPQPLQ